MATKRKAGWASLRVEAPDAHSLRFVVEDNGKGLSEIDRTHLFDPFYSGRQAGRGRGLGLPTSWALARQQGGDVYLASQEGETTRFVLRLPLPAEQIGIRAG